MLSEILLYAIAECQGAGRAAHAGTQEADLNDVLWGEADVLDVASVALNHRSNGIDDSADAVF